MVARRQRGSDTVGSHQSSEEVARDAAKQPALLAAAAKRKGKSVAGPPKTIQKSRFSLKSIASPSSWKSGKRAGKPESKAVFSKFMKGGNEGEYSGAIYFRGKPCFGDNERFKKDVQQILLAEPLRWNTELTLFTGKVWTKVQAEMVLEAIKKLSEKNEADLSDVAIDGSIFEDAKEAALDTFPITVDEQEMFGIVGTSYPFKDKLDKMGFKFRKSVNGTSTPMWLAPIESVDQEELHEMFTSYGFTVTQHNGVTDDEDEGEE